MAFDEAAIREVAEGARRAGRPALLESEGYRVLEALGIAVPARAFVRSPDEARALDLGAFPGDRVVVKAVAAGLLHKSEAGGVAVVARERGAVADAVAAMEARLRAHRPEGWLVLEFVPHDAAPGSELLLGARHTPDFGPVVTLGQGGVYAEYLAAALRPGTATTIVAPGGEAGTVARAVERNALVPMITGRLRGQTARVRPESLTDLVERFLTFAERFIPDVFTDFEVNPVGLGPDGPVALDVLATLSDGPVAAPPPRPVEKLRNLLRPESIAVIGVSERMNPGRIILQNILREGFPPERVTVVKPGGDRIDGCRCVESIEAIPGRVDLAVLSIAAAQVPGHLARFLAGEKAESVIVIPGGLGELEGSESIVEELTRALHASRATPWRGPLLNGGNCLGVRSRPGRFDTLFIPAHKLPPPTAPEAPLALVSQSGAFAVARQSSLDPLNPRYLVTLGNQMDLTVGDYLTHLADDEAVRVFACYVEGFRPGDGRRWLDAARRITASGRSVILYRAGRTAEGAKATASHTASIASDYAVTRELARAADVVVAESLGEFEDLVRLFVALDDRAPAGRRLGALSNAGFESVAMADALGRFRLAGFSAATRARLDAILAAGKLTSIVGVHNPLDVTPMLGDAPFVDACRAVLEDDGVDAAVIGCVPLTGAMRTLPAGSGHGEDMLAPGATVDGLARLRAECAKPWVAVVDSGALYDPLVRALEAARIPVFRHADRALRVFDRWVAARLGEPL